MSLRRKIVASYISQLYAALIAILMVPVYVRQMGAEAYGLVGFYAMLQAWFQMLDMGLAPTMSRQTARHVGGAVDALMLRRLLRVLELVFIAVALTGGLALAWSADWVALHWLHVEKLPPDQVSTAVVLMAGIIGLRWVAGLYRGAVGGFEQQVWLGQLNIVTATARFVVVVVIFEWWGTTPAHFFGYQLLVAVVETTLLAARTYQLMPDVPPGTNIGFHFKPLAAVLRFSLSVAFTGAVWVAVTQIDKLMLSGLLPLSEYAHFTLAVLVASGVTIVSGPLSSALLPRLTRLHAQQDHAGLIKLYRQATQAMGVIVMPVALVLAFSAEPLLRAWTGDAVLAAKSAPILRLYALGNGILALAAFPYYLQFAKGDVRLHLVGNLLFLLLLVPGIMFAVSKFGAAGAGWAWLGANGIYAVLWVPLVHRRFAVGLHRVWLIVDVVPVLIAVVSSVWIMTLLVKWPSHRSGIAFNLAFIMLIALLAGIFASSYARSWLFQRLNFRITR